MISSLSMEIITLIIQGFNSCRNLCTCVVSGQQNRVASCASACCSACAGACQGCCWQRPLLGSLGMARGCAAGQHPVRVGGCFVLSVSGLLHPLDRNDRNPLPAVACTVICGGLNRSNSADYSQMFALFTRSTTHSRNSWY